MAKSVKWLAPRGPERWLHGRRQKELPEAMASLAAEFRVFAWRALADRWVCVGVVLAREAPAALANLQALMKKHNGCDFYGDISERLYRELFFLIALGECLELDISPAVRPRELTETARLALVNGWWMLEGPARKKAGQEAVPFGQQWDHPLTIQMLQTAHHAFDALRDRACLQQVVEGRPVELMPAQARRL